MFKLSDLYASLLKKTMATDCGIAIEPLNAEVAILNRLLLEDRVSFFSINLISSGNVTIIYGGNRIDLSKNDLFISAPGIQIYTESVSNDYSGICLIVEEDILYELPYAINAISTSYILANPGLDNKLSLPDADFKILQARIEDMQEYILGSNPYKAECLFSLFAVFSFDLLNIESHFIDINGISSSSSELFYRFLRLLRENFAKHHEIGFYADALAVTSIYLSRIVKKISGQTVKNHVDRLLMMEAKFLLVRSNLAIATIGEKLGFETPAGFCKFFLRHQGVSPKDYRISNTKENAERSNI